MKKAVLIGNYGQANFGDEMLKEYFLRRFPAVEWTILVTGRPSAPNEVPRLPLGIRSLFWPWWRTISAIRKSDVVVFGGGTLFTDIESLKACAIWGWHALVSRLLRKPVILAAQGIGPFKTGLGEWIAQEVVERAASVIVRDDKSYDRIKNWKKNTDIVQTFDPVFSLLQGLKTEVGSQNVLIVIPRLNSGESFYETVKQELASGAYKKCKVVLLEPDHPEEKRQCSVVLSLSPLPSETVELRSLSDLPQALSDAKLMITQRYHGAIIALAAGIPFRGVAQAKDDKIDALAQMAGDREGLLMKIEALETELAKYLR